MKLKPRELTSKEGSTYAFSTKRDSDLHFLQRGIYISAFYNRSAEDPVLLKRLIFTEKSINVSQEILLVGEERL